MLNHLITQLQSSRQVVHSLAVVVSIVFMGFLGPMKEMEKMGPKGPVGTKDKAGAKGEAVFCYGRWYFTLSGVECKSPLAIDCLQHIGMNHRRKDYNIQKVTQIAATSKKYVVSSLKNVHSQENKHYTTGSTVATPRVWSDTPKMYTAECCIPGAIATVHKGSRKPFVIMYKNSDNSTTYLSEWNGEILDRICSRFENQVLRIVLCEPSWFAQMPVKDESDKFFSVRVTEKLQFASDATELAKLTGVPDETSKASQSD
ncbi:hypothetical protein AWC38_SpisGene10178 [Stylophora pistillata]|uniref:Uncharacterized protein n=1 Tax=Stylophora pistillata TaxID=50429 RepID=A0A2B4S8S3_STYPI|nr:hypothetical protein AWC38_SpisGene10178 [Stylophora pistillata]